MQKTDDIHVRQLIPIVSPSELNERLPMTEGANETIVAGRQAICNILKGDDSRLIAVVGPCSIHDEKAALDYAERMLKISKQVEERILVVMRVYFEKPRTTVGWKGLINDPYLNGTFDIETGLEKARGLLRQVAEMGLPAGTEVLDPITPQYMADLVCWASIGARTTESQTHRQMASGLSMPVGYKNGTDGNLQTAIDAMLAARHAHAFLGIDHAGQTCVIHTAGNPWGHLILRGGRSGQNYDESNLATASEALKGAGLPANIMVDCSHANSEKDYTRQANVWRNVIAQRAAGNTNLFGLMLESNLNPGSQKLTDPDKLAYGVSITDACIGWDETETLLLEAYETLGK